EKAATSWFRPSPVVGRGCGSPGKRGFRSAWGPQLETSRSAALKMNEVGRVVPLPRGYCPCVIVVRVTVVVLRNRHVAIGVHCLAVSNVSRKPRDSAAPRSFVVRYTRESSRIDPVACTFPADILVAGGERYSTLVQLISDIARTFAYPLVPFVQDPLASIRSGAYTSGTIRAG